MGPWWALEANYEVSVKMHRLDPSYEGLEGPFKTKETGSTSFMHDDISQFSVNS